MTLAQRKKNLLKSSNYSVWPFLNHKLTIFNVYFLSRTLILILYNETTSPQVHCMCILLDNNSSYFEHLYCKKLESRNTNYGEKINFIVLLENRDADFLIFGKIGETEKNFVAFF